MGGRCSPLSPPSMKMWQEASWWNISWLWFTHPSLHSIWRQNSHHGANSWGEISGILPTGEFWPCVLLQQETAHLWAEVTVCLSAQGSSFQSIPHHKTTTKNPSLKLCCELEASAQIKTGWAGDGDENLSLCGAAPCTCHGQPTLSFPHCCSSPLQFGSQGVKSTNTKHLQGAEQVYPPQPPPKPAFCAASLPDPPAGLSNGWARADLSHSFSKQWIKRVNQFGEEPRKVTVLDLSITQDKCFNSPFAKLYF